MRNRCFTYVSVTPVDVLQFTVNFGLIGYFLPREAARLSRSWESQFCLSVFVRPSACLSFFKSQFTFLYLNRGAEATLELKQAGPPGQQFQGRKEQGDRGGDQRIYYWAT